MAGRYTRVGSKKGPLVIGGALSKFEQEPDFMYVPMYRIAGPSDEVAEWLKENHPDEAKTAIKGSYSKSSLKTSSIRSAFDKEVEAASKERQEQSVFRQELKSVNLMVLVNLLQKYDSLKKTEGETGETSKRTVRTLKDKLMDIVKEKRFLDVTNMTDKGTDSKKVKVEKGSMKRHLSQNKKDPLYHVVYNASSKSAVTGVRNFMNQYGTFSDREVSAATDAVADGSMINLNKTKSPTRSPLVSPRRQKTAKSRKTAVTDSAGDELDDILNSLPGN